MPLVAFALLVSLLMSRILAARWPHLTPENGVLGVFAIVAIGGAIARLSMAFAAALFETTHRLSQAYHSALRSRQFLQWLWILSSPFLLAIVGWGSTVRFMLERVAKCTPFAAEQSETLSIILWAIPSVIFMTILDLSWFEMEGHVQHGKGGNGNMLESIRTHRYDSFLPFWWNQIKHNWLMVLIPTLIICGLLDLAQPLHIEHASIGVRCFLYLIAIGFGLIALPEILALSWRAKPLPPSEVRNQVESVWRKLGFSSTSILTWSSNMRICNALVLGFLPWRRKILLSDLLLQRLPMAQIEMILCHEAAHILRGHLYLRATPFALSLGNLLLLRYIYDSNDSIRAWTDTNSVVISMLAVVKLGVALWFSSRIAKWTEKDADRFAVELAIRFGLGREMNPQGMKPVSPAQHLVDALETASQGSHRRRASWLYPSIQERTEALLTNQPTS